MHVKLLKMKRVQEKGRMITRYAGDWVNVGRATALSWIAAGEAETYDPEIMAASVGYTAGMLYRGAMPAHIKEILVDKHHAMKTELLADGSFPHLPYSETLFWDTSAPLRTELIPLGFHQLGTWQAAIPLYSLDVLACDMGSEADRARTQEAILDLRVPVFDTRLMYVARCKQTRDLFTLWREEAADGGDERLAFMRAVWWVKPVICALPITWTEAGYVPA